VRCCGKSTQAGAWREAVRLKALARNVSVGM
jgi:hypothetical protein